MVLNIINWKNGEIEDLSDNNEYYAVNFKIQQKSFFSIWISAQNGDMFLKKNNQLGRMSSLYIFINIVYSLPKKLKYADNQGFQRAQGTLQNQLQQ